MADYHRRQPRGVENGLLLKLVKYFEMSVLQGRENRKSPQIRVIPYFSQNFDRPIGSRAINKFLEGKISEKLAFNAAFSLELNESP